jgi:hypothetical protein
MVTTERARRLLSKHGAIRSQAASEWLGSISLPASIERFYRDVGPADVTINAYGNPFFLPSLSGLWAIQAGYRWHGLTGERLADWKDDWLVVGYEGSGALMVSLSAEQVSFAMNGAGVWDPKVLFPDLTTMAACLAALGLIASGAGNDFADDDCLIRPQHLADAKAQVAEMVGSSMEAEVVLTTLGWK